jgi:wyosine [tRNA(Phe)-imidazoG37] synthetase (radical SAM superfamily)
MMSKRRESPFLVVGDGEGNVFEIPSLRMTGMILDRPCVPSGDELIELAFGGELFELPGRIPVGYDPRRDEFVEVPSYRGHPVVAVAAFMAPAYVQYYRAAWQTLSEAPRLPLYCYTAVGWRDDSFVVPAVRVDADERQDLRNVDCELIERRARRMLEHYSGNRLVHHLMTNCVMRYGCPAARNLAMGRWECPVPTSPSCNARCVGCISEQPSSNAICASQERIDFVPTPEEIIAYTVPHLERAPRAVISFGQGCEGEPLMQAEVLEEGIRGIRCRTKRGIINLNTNGSRPEVVERLCAAGLDSIRVSMNSAQPELYLRYHRPVGYTFSDVHESLRVVRRHGGWASINYFMFPGLTNMRKETEALRAVVNDTKLNMIQARNLNMDPEWYAEMLCLQSEESDMISMREWFRWVRHELPWVKLGYFNPPRGVMRRHHYTEV